MTKPATSGGHLPKASALKARELKDGALKKGALNDRTLTDRSQERRALKHRVPQHRTLKDDPLAILHHWREAVPNDRLAHLVKDATRVLTRALQLRLAEHGVSFGHWTFLRILWEHDGLTQRELSNAAGVMEPTTHAALNAMEQLKLVERRRLEGDQRNMHVFLTPAGKRLKRTLVPHAIAVNGLAVKGFAPADIAATRRVLLGIIENLAG